MRSGLTANDGLTRMLQPIDGNAASEDDLDC